MRAAIRGLRDEDRPLWADALRFAPDTARSRVSKFQPCLPDHLARDLMVEKLVDLASARLVLGLDPELPARPAAFGYVHPTIPITWVRTPEEFADGSSRLTSESFVALDVETTLTDHELCLIQLGTPAASYLIDPLTVGDLAPLKAVLESPTIEKVTHTAQSSSRSSAPPGIGIENIYDTVIVVAEALRHARRRTHLARRDPPRAGPRGRQAVPDERFDPAPLTEEQVTYAALDVEVRLRAAFGGGFRACAVAPASDRLCGD